MKIISVTNQKGGVGKTTIATALAVAADQGGLTVALLDLDPQASACFWSDRRKASGRDTGLNVRDVNFNRLPNYLEALSQSGCDLVVLDCPPVHRDIASTAAAVADLVLIPTRAEALDLRATTEAVRMVQQLGKTPSVVLTFCPPSGAEVEQAKAIIAKLGADRADVDLHLRKDFPRAQADGMTALEFDPAGKAAWEIVRLYNHAIKKLYTGDEANEKFQSRRRA